MLLANLSYFYEMLRRINAMADYVSPKSNYCIVNSTPVRQVTSRSVINTTSQNFALGVGNGNTAYGLSTNSRQSANLAEIDITDYPYVTLVTQTVAQWKRTLTNEYVSLSGGVGFSNTNAPNSGTTAMPQNIIFGHTDMLGNNFEIDDSLYDTTLYDDYLIVKSIYPYTADYQTSSKIIHQCRSRATAMYARRTTGQNVANDTNNLITFSPWDCMPSNSSVAWNPLVDLYNITDGTVGDAKNLTLRINQFKNIPFVPAWRVPINSVSPVNIVGFDTRAYTLSPREIIYMFPDFESIQQWFWDFGIKAYASVNDMYEDNFPEDIDDNIGYPDNPVPDITDAYPDNSSDPTDFAQPALTNTDLYNIYLLNSGSYKTFRSTLATSDIWRALQNWISTPLNSVYGLKLMPLNFISHDPSGVQQSDHLTLLTTTLPNIPCYKVLSNYKFWNFNLGNLQLYPYYGNYLDYIANYYLYVPCCSSISLEPTAILGKTIRLRGIVDLVSGDMTVDVIVDDNIVAQTSGNISYSISLSFDDVAQRQNNIILQKIGGVVFNSIMGNGAGVLKEVGEGAIDYATTRDHIESAGSISFNNAIYDYTTPYLKICLKIPSQPSNYKQLQGINSSATVKISQLEGYVKGTPYGKWQISGATLTEIDRIKQIIQSGFYI